MQARRWKDAECLIAWWRGFSVGVSSVRGGDARQGDYREFILIAEGEREAAGRRRRQPVCNGGADTEAVGTGRLRTNSLKPGRHQVSTAPGSSSSMVVRDTQSQFELVSSSAGRTRAAGTFFFFFFFCKPPSKPTSQSEGHGQSPCRKRRKAAEQS